jgi:hypothetical protein
VNLGSGIGSSVSFSITRPADMVRFGTAGEPRAVGQALVDAGAPTAELALTPRS